MLVLATGFKTHGFVAPMEIVGADGRTLAQEWAGVPRAYLGMSVPGFPNMFLLYGPNTNGGSGSVIHVIESGMGHVIAALRELERTGARRIEVTRSGAEQLRPRAARAPRAERVAHGLHQLVRGRAGQRPEPVAVAVDHVQAPHVAGRSRGLRDRLAGRLRGTTSVC